MKKTIEMLAVCLFALAGLTISARAQLSYTVTSTTWNCGGGGLSGLESYSNWAYTDPAGVHRFIGTSDVYETDGQCSGYSTGFTALSTDGEGYSLTTLGSTGTISLPPPGAIDPKYAVLSVQYAPPGAKSFADYGTSTNQGTSTSFKQTFSSQTTESVSIGIGKTDDIFGIDGSNIPSGGVTTSYSNSNTLEQDTSTSFAITKMNSYDTQVLGPSTNAVGLDHNNDTVTIWLNPVYQLTTVNSSTIALTGVYWDTLDGCNPTTQTCDGTAGMDTITLQVAQLLNPSLITDQFQLNQLARSWAPFQADGSSPGLTATDLHNIAAADPYTNISYTPTFTTYADGTCSNASAGIAAGRFCLSTNNNYNIQYAGPQQGGQNGPTTYKMSYTTTATEAQNTMDTYSTTYSIDANASGGWLAWFTVDVNDKKTLTWINQWSTQTSNANSTSASTTITPPGYSDNYQGPTEFALYQDTLYGTFMYLAVPFPGWLLSASPASQTVIQGKGATFTVATTASDGGAGTVSGFTVAGLPTGATAVFSPTSVSVGGTSTLAVNTTTATPPGTYSLTVSGAIGTNLAHSVVVTLVVNAAPGFSISATPSSETISAGGSTPYTVSTAALNGFSGVVALAASSLPSGVSATFSPTSITGSGSSTLTVKSTASTKAGTYTLTITGTSGSLTHTTTVQLIVSAPDFTLSVSPGSRGVAAGSKAIYTVTTTALGGFTGSVALTLTGLPSGASAVFSPTSISKAGTSTLTVTTSKSTPVGNYNLVVKGTSGSLTHTFTVVLTVNAS